MLPDGSQDLLERPIVATLVTLMPDNQPQATPVWVNYDGEYVLVNTAKGRQKDRNVMARPQATVLIVDPENTLRFLEIRGVIAERTEDGALEHVNELSLQYDGNPDFYGDDIERKNRETRVIIKIKPTRIVYRRG